MTLILLVCLSLLGYCLVVRRYTSWRIEYTPFFVVSSVIVFLYGFAYFDFLKPGALGVLIIGWLLSAYAMYFLYQERKVLFAKYLTPGFLISILFLSLFMLLATQVRFAGFDEFTQWGPHAKLVFFNNGFVKASDVTIHKTYPLGGALFYYFFFQLTGYSEGVAYAAQCLLTMAPLSILLAKYNWQQWRKAFIAYAFTLFILLLLKIQIGPVDTLYMDGVVGIYFGMMLVSYFQSKRQIGNVLYLLPIVAAFESFKMDVMPFVLLITTIILIDQLVLNRKKVLPSISAVAMLLASAFIMSYSWHVYLQKINVPSEWRINFSWHLSTIQQRIFDGYFIKLSHSITFIALAALLNLIAYFAYQIKKEKIHLCYVNTLLFGGFIAYAMGLLIMYLFSFTVYEALSYASMSRYLGIYYLGWALVTLFYLYDATKSIDFRFSKLFERLTIVAFVSGILGLQIIHLIRLHNPEHELHSVRKMRQPIAQIANAVKKYTQPHDSVYTIWQDSEGYQRGMMVYELTPRKPNLGCVSFGAAYTKGDAWTCNLSSSEFLKKFQQFDYLLLAYVDQNFWHHYGMLFHNTDLKPLVSYRICQGKGFAQFGTPGCHMQKHSAYLFKVMHTKNGVQLKNVI